jgi:hypothetical protein
MTIHVDIVFRVGFIHRLPKSLMGYIKMNLNMGITFRVKYSYNFTLLTPLFSPTTNLALIF